MLDRATDQPSVETGRLLLRPARMSDAGLLGVHTADIRIARATRSIPHPLPPGATEAFIARAMSSERHEDIWVIDGTPADLPEVMGVVGFQRLDRHQSEIAFWVAPAFWGAGIASEAVEALIRANPQQSCALFASVFQDNPASAQLLSNLGFIYLGDAECYCVARHAMLATWTYSLKL